MTPTRTLAYGATIALLAFTIGCAQPAPPAHTAAPAAPAHDMAMDLHHMHGLMAHGLEMALEGASLRMVGQMGMSGAVDATAMSHGDMMVSEGRALIDSVFGGPAMAAMHATGASDPAMVYTHDLAKNMTLVIDKLQQMPAPNAKNTKEMAQHHMHIAMIHAALMASQGASLKMTAAMKMSELLDKDAAEHAAAMLEHAKALYGETMNGDAMKAEHAAATGDDMVATHALGDSVNALIDALAKMP